MRDYRLPILRRFLARLVILTLVAASMIAVYPGPTPAAADTNPIVNTLWDLAASDETVRTGFDWKTDLNYTTADVANLMQQATVVDSMDRLVHWDPTMWSMLIYRDDQKVAEDALYPAMELLLTPDPEEMQVVEGAIVSTVDEVSKVVEAEGNLRSHTNLAIDLQKMTWDGAILKLHEMLVGASPQDAVLIKRSIANFENAKGVVENVEKRLERTGKLLQALDYGQRSFLYLLKFGTLAQTQNSRADGVRMLLDGLPPARTMWEKAIRNTADKSLAVYNQSDAGGKALKIIYDAMPAAGDIAVDALTKKARVTLWPTLAWDAAEVFSSDMKAITEAAPLMRTAWAASEIERFALNLYRGKLYQVRGNPGAASKEDWEFLRQSALLYLRSSVLAREQMSKAMEAVAADNWWQQVKKLDGRNTDTRQLISRWILAALPTDQFAMSQSTLFVAVPGSVREYSYGDAIRIYNPITVNGKSYTALGTRSGEIWYETVQDGWVYESGLRDYFGEFMYDQPTPLRPLQMRLGQTWEYHQLDKEYRREVIAVAPLSTASAYYPKAFKAAEWSRRMSSNERFVATGYLWYVDNIGPVQSTDVNGSVEWELTELRLDPAQDPVLPTSTYPLRPGLGGVDEHSDGTRHPWMVGDPVVHGDRRMAPLSQDGKTSYYYVAKDWVYGLDSLASGNEAKPLRPVHLEVGTKWSSSANGWVFSFQVVAVEPLTIRAGYFPRAYRVEEWEKPEGSNQLANFVGTIWYLDDFGKVLCKDANGRTTYEAVAVYSNMRK